MSQFACFGWVMAGLLSLYACSSDDAGGTGSSSSSSGGTSGQDGGSSGDAAQGTSSGGTSSGGTSSGNPVTSPVMLKLDGHVTDGGTDYYIPENRPTGFSVEIGQAAFALPKEAQILIEVRLDNTKTGSGTYGTEAVSNVSGLLGINQDPKKGTYATMWSPTKTNGIDFTLAVANGKATFKWKGTMTVGGGSTTVDVDAEGTDVPLVK